MRRWRIAAALVAAVAIVVVAGRVEVRHGDQVEMNEMRVVLAAVGDIRTAQPTGYRLGPPNCLAYSTPVNRVGLQLCFDPTGRLVETVDRRPVQPVYASLAYDPSRSTIRFPQALIDRLLRSASAG